MATRKKSTPKKQVGMRVQPKSKAQTSPAASGPTRSSARTTVSSPSQRPDATAVSDAATAKLAGTEALAAKFPFNAA